MKINLNWLRDYCDWSWSEEELVEKLTMSGTEVEGIHRTGFIGSEQHFIAVRIESFEKHPNADKLSVCQVNDGKGSGLRQIVCGAKNFKAGDVVPCALPGAVMLAGFEIKDSKLRGERSSGMLCSSVELGLPAGEDGLLILSSKVEPGTALTKLFHGETVLEVEVTPNRADLLSYRGLARELIALGAEDKNLKHSSLKAHASAGTWIAKIDDEDLCPRYTGRLLENITVAESPDWLKGRLLSMGLRPINNVVDITNYVLLELGQPLHAFDAQVLKGETLFIRKAQECETIQALDGKTYALKTTDLVIADETDPIAIAGVMGGQTSSVQSATKSIILESASFKAGSVRATSRRLALISESSYRFERGVDSLAVDLAMERATELLVELAGARVADSFATKPEQVEARTITLRLDSIEKVLGYRITESRVNEILTALGCQSEGLVFQIPSYRPDLLREIDLIEELSRIEGMVRVQATLPRGVAARSSADIQYDREWELRRFLTNRGYTEWVTGSLHARSEASSEAIELINPLTEDYAQLRSSLLSTTLPCVRTNLSQSALSIKAFEIGTVYRQVKGRSIEERRLIILGCGLDQTEQWNQESRVLDYFNIKGLLEAVAQSFPEIKIQEEFGPVPEAVLKTFSIKVPVLAAELTLKLTGRKAASQYVPLTQYPSVRRDLAFVVDRGVRQEDLLKVIRSTSIAELQGVECFDVFQDDQGVKLAKEKKSLAYALTYRSSERTLTDSEVSQWQTLIVSTAQAKLGAVLR